MTGSTRPTTRWSAAPRAGRRAARGPGRGATASTGSRPGGFGRTWHRRSIDDVSRDSVTSGRGYAPGPPAAFNEQRRGRQFGVHVHLARGRGDSGGPGSGPRYQHLRPALAADASGEGLFHIKQRPHPVSCVTGRPAAWVRRLGRRDIRPGRRPRGARGSCRDASLAGSPIVPMPRPGTRLADSRSISSKQG